jgi:hypothetical protein
MGILTRVTGMDLLIHTLHLNGSGFLPFIKDFYHGHSYPGDRYGPSYPYLHGHDLWILNP